MGIIWIITDVKPAKYFRNKKRKYLKDKIDELATNRKKKNIRDLFTRINYFKRGYLPRSNLVKDDMANSLKIPTF
jgi:hypothetical protein